MTQALCERRICKAVGSLRAQGRPVFESGARALVGVFRGALALVLVVLGVVGVAAVRVHDVLADQTVVALVGAIQKNEDQVCTEIMESSMVMA